LRSKRPGGEAGDIAAIKAAFHREHLAIYDFNDEAAGIQVINLRLVITGMTARPALTPAPLAAGDAVPAREVDVWLDGEFRRVPLYSRSELAHGQRIRGPAIAVQEDTTVCIPAAFDGLIDAHLNLNLALNS